MKKMIAKQKTLHKELNVKFKLDIPTDHAVNNPQCYFILDKIGQLKSRTNYG